MNNQKVSIIIPMFNNESHIGETLNSIILQDYAEWETICVDDLSTDNTVAVVKEYSRKDSRIKLLIRDREPKGGSVCRNIGAAYATGDYFVFLDADDLLEPFCLSKRLETTVGKGYFLTAYVMGRFVNNPDEVICSPRVLKNKDYKFLAATSRAPWQVTSTFWPRELFTRLGGFDEHFPRLQDVELHLRALLEIGNNFRYYTELPSDCLYRQIGITEQNAQIVKKEKLDRALIASRFFVKLVVDNHTRFGSSWIYSKTLLHLMTNIAELVLNSSQADNCELIMKEIDQGIVINHIIGPHRILYKGLLSINHHYGRFTYKCLLMYFRRFSLER